MSTRPIAIAGDLGLGKSTLAKKLAAALPGESKIVAFGDELKKAYAVHSGLTIEEVRAKPTPTHIRQGLVDFSAGARYADETIWARKVDQLMLEVEKDRGFDCPRFICDDMRYHWELDVFQRWGTFSVILRDMDSRKIIANDHCRQQDFIDRFDMVIDLYPESWGEGRPQFTDVDEIRKAYRAFLKRR